MKLRNTSPKFQIPRPTIYSSIFPYISLQNIKKGVGGILVIKHVLNLKKIN